MTSPMNLLCGIFSFINIIILLARYIHFYNVTTILASDKALNMQYTKWNHVLYIITLHSSFPPPLVMHNRSISYFCRIL